VSTLICVVIHESSLYYPFVLCTNVCPFVIPLFNHFCTSDAILCRIIPLLRQISNISSQFFGRTMPCTIKDKYKLGKQFIDGLHLNFRCHEFHGQYLKCNCICNLTLDQLSCVKTYFSGSLQNSLGS